MGIKSGSEIEDSDSRHCHDAGAALADTEDGDEIFGHFRTAQGHCGNQRKPICGPPKNDSSVVARHRFLWKVWRTDHVSTKTASWPRLVKRAQLLMHFSKGTEPTAGLAVRHASFTKARTG